MPKRQKAEPIPCSNCGRLVTRRGPRTGIGRYCAARQCQAAYRREYRARQTTGEPMAWESRPCTNCGADMATRPRRSSDLDEGRWCMSYECQKHKRRVLARVAEARKVREATTAEERAAFQRDLEKAWAEARVETCPTCKRENARDGFVHPWPNQNTPCRALGGHMPPESVMPELMILWADAAMGGAS